MKIIITRRKLKQLRNAALWSQQLKSTIVRGQKPTSRQLIAVEKANAEAITTLNELLGEGWRS